MTKKIVLWFVLFLLACTSLDSTTAAVTSEGASEKPLPGSCCCIELVKMADTTITGTKVYPADLQVPTPGDDVKAAVAPGAVRPAYQKLINGLSGAQAQLYGRISRYRVVGIDNNNMSIGHVGAFVVKNGAGDWQAYSDVNNAADYGSAGTFLTVDPTALYGAALTDGRYWVYLKAPTGADPYDVVVVKGSAMGDRPDENLMYRTGDQTQILLSTFYVWNNQMLPYLQIGGKFTYQKKTLGPAGNGNSVLYNTSVTVSTAVNFGSSVPYTPISVTVIFQAYSSAGPPVTFRATAGGDTVTLAGAGGDLTLWGDNGAALFPMGQFDTMGNGSQFYYICDSPDTVASAWIRGFQLW